MLAFFKKIFDFDKELFIKVILTTFIFGLLAHGFCFANAFFTHDGMEGINCGIESGQWAWKISLGRFMQPLYYLVRGDLTAPWLIGTLSLLWLSLSNYLIIRLLKLSESWMNLLICGLTTTHLVVSTTNSVYMHECDTYMLALLFAVLAVFSVRQWKWGWIYAGLCTIVTLGLYQAYFAVTVSLYMVLLAKDLLSNENAKKCFLQSIRFVATLIGALLIYTLLIKLSFELTGCYPENGDNSIEKASFSDMGNFSSPIWILMFTGNTCKMFFLHYFQQPTAYPYIEPAINTILALITIAGLIRFCFISKLKTSNLILLIGVLSLLPLGTNIIYFISKGNCHTLMRFSFVCPFFLTLLVLNLNLQLKQGLKLSKMITAGGLGFLIFANIVFANQLYLQRELVYQNDLTIKTRILYELEHHPDYHFNETPVAFIGSSWFTPMNNLRPGFEHLSKAFGVNGNMSFTHYRTNVAIFKTELGYPIKMVPKKETYRLHALPEVQAMPIFPNPGYVKMVEGTLVIKLADDENPQ